VKLDLVSAYIHSNTSAIPDFPQPSQEDRRPIGAVSRYRPKQITRLLFDRHGPNLCPNDVGRGASCNGYSASPARLYADRDRRFRGRPLTAWLFLHPPHPNPRTRPRTTHLHDMPDLVMVEQPKWTRRGSRLLLHAQPHARTPAAHRPVCHIVWWGSRASMSREPRELVGPGDPTSTLPRQRTVTGARRPHPHPSLPETGQTQAQARGGRSRISGPKIHTDSRHHHYAVERVVG
jgi:hypothetical protein